MPDFEDYFFSTSAAEAQPATDKATSLSDRDRYALDSGAIGARIAANEVNAAYGKLRAAHERLKSHTHLLLKKIPIVGSNEDCFYSPSGALGEEALLHARKYLSDQDIVSVHAPKDLFSVGANYVCDADVYIAKLRPVGLLVDFSQAGRCEDAPRQDDGREESEMAVVVEDVPPGINWGWFSREDPRMHLQSVNNKYRNRYKVWLERDGRHAFEVVGAMPVSMQAELQEYVDGHRMEIDAAWISMMVLKNWLSIVVANGMVTITSYPNTAQQFIRQIDLRDHIGAAADSIRPVDVALCDDPAAVIVWPDKPASKQVHIDLTEIIFVD